MADRQCPTKHPRLERAQKQNLFLDWKELKNRGLGIASLHQKLTTITFRVHSGKDNTTVIERLHSIHQQQIKSSNKKRENTFIICFCWWLILKQCCNAHKLLSSLQLVGSQPAFRGQVSQRYCLKDWSCILQTSIAIAALNCQCKLTEGFLAQLVSLDFLE